MMSATRSPRNLPMKPLSKWQNAIFVVGAVLMVIGAASSILRWQYYPYVFSVGAIGYAVVQMMQQYEGNSFVVRRLLRIQVISDLLLILTGVLMFANEGNAFGLEWLNYLNYVQNNWVVTLLLAAILQLYTTKRIGKELEKEAKKL